MENEKKIRVALIRGDNLGEWEIKLYEKLSDSFEMTAFRSLTNTYKYTGINIPIFSSLSSQDNFFLKNFHKYILGQYKVMYGLSNKLINFDIAHTLELYNYNTIQAIRAKRKNKKLKVVVYVADNTFGRFEYNYWPGFSSPPTYWRNKINKIIQETVSGADAFQAVTNQSAELLRDYGVPEKKIHIIPPGIVVTPEADLELKKIEWILSLIKKKKTYLVVSRLTKEKGVYEIIYGWKIFLRTCKNNDDKLLLIIGDGPERKNLQRIIKESGLSKNIVMIQQLENQLVRLLYRYVHCLILGSIPTPFWQEQFGYVLAEAIINECPVVATYSGAIPEVVDGNGLLFSPGDPVGLAKKLIELEKIDLYAHLKANCEKSKDKFSQEKFCNEIKKIYFDLSNKFI